MSDRPADAARGLSAGESRLLDRLSQSAAAEDEITLATGSGLGDGAVPRIAGILQIADDYARGRSDDGRLLQALQQARAIAGDGPPVGLYVAYRRVFDEWVSPGGFDVIAQQAVLRAYHPIDRMSSPLASHGLWQPIGLSLGERIENDRVSWQLPAGAHAAGYLLAGMPDLFGQRVLTTSFDPLLEIAIRSAGKRAISLPLDAQGDWGAVGSEDAFRVYHVHGFWRPTLQVPGPGLLHDPGTPVDPGEPLVSAVAGLVHGDTIVVVGAGAFAGTLVAAISTVARIRPLRVLWALHNPDEQAAAAFAARLGQTTGTAVECFADVDVGRFFPALAARSGILIPARDPGPRHRHRHHNWERQLVSQPDAVPPDDVPGLLRQLERRFGWTTQQASPTVAPRRLLWPVLVQPRASVIHMVQAFVAGALARIGVEVVVCLDDFGARDARSLSAFQADLARWIAYVDPAAEATFVRLNEFVEEQNRQAVDNPESLLRPTYPWGVARAFYGEHNPSLYHVLAAVKAVPNLTTTEELQRNAWPIVQALLSQDANRVLTPLTQWSFLHAMLRDGPSEEVMTLGGRDEAFFWAMWQDAFGGAVSQLHNPSIQGLSHGASRLRWSSVGELRGYLDRTRELPGWDAEGSYIHWLFQNAMLLPTYLNHEAVPRLGDLPLDSWAAFVAAVQEGAAGTNGAAALNLLAERVTALYLGDAAG